MSQQVDDILIVDDVASSRELLAGLLKQVSTLAVRHAGNGTAAVEAFRTRPPAITFLDIELPDQSGLDILQRLRAEQAKAFVVIISGSGTADNVKTSREHGASAFILKPFKPQKVVDALKLYERESGAKILRSEHA